LVEQVPGHVPAKLLQSLLPVDEPQVAQVNVNFNFSLFHNPIFAIQMGEEHRLERGDISNFQIQLMASLYSLGISRAELEGPADPVVRRTTTLFSNIGYINDEVDNGLGEIEERRSDSVSCTPRGTPSLCPTHEIDHIRFRLFFFDHAGALSRGYYSAAHGEAPIVFRFRPFIHWV
jgi:hypothetical protein